MFCDRILCNIIQAENVLYPIQMDYLLLNVEANQKYTINVVSK